MSESMTVKKWWWVWEYEEELRWLNSMAMQGWTLDKVSFPSYHFIKTEPGEYIISLEMRQKDEEYISFMRELNAEYIGRVTSWIYFRRKAEYGDFDIFSDIDSKITHLNRISKMLSIVCYANLTIGVANSFNPTINIGFINLLGGALLAYALGRIHSKEADLKYERSIRE